MEEQRQVVEYQDEQLNPQEMDMDQLMSASKNKGPLSQSIHIGEEGYCMPVMFLPDTEDAPTPAPIRLSSNNPNQNN